MCVQTRYESFVRIFEAFGEPEDHATYSEYIPQLSDKSMSGLKFSSYFSHFIDIYALSKVPGFTTLISMEYTLTVVTRKFVFGNS